MLQFINLAISAQGNAEESYKNKRRVSHEKVVSSFIGTRADL